MSSLCLMLIKSSWLNSGSELTFLTIEGFRFYIVCESDSLGVVHLRQRGFIYGGGGGAVWTSYANTGQRLFTLYVEGIIFRPNTS